MKITAPVKYKSCVITPASGAKGFDVFDGTGRWFHTETQRQARWWASVYSTATERFQASPVREVPVCKDV
jgi:hypothetical protein